jgi:predicted DNA-binding transcriptional regulator YafY
MPGREEGPEQADMSNTATRLITLIMLLQREPNQKAAQLAKRLGVSVRTVHRYFTMLDEMGIPIYSERGPHGGFSMVRGYKMPPLVLTPDEAVAIYLGTSLVDQMWGRLYREPARGALAKLENLLPDEQRSEVAWARRSLTATGMHRIRPETLETELDTLRRAIREERPVRMLYGGLDAPEPSYRDVEPYGLAHGAGWWYLVGHCRLRKAMRTFRVDRIQELALLNETFEMPGDFDLHAHLAAGFPGRPEVRMLLRFAPEAKGIALHNLAVWETVDERPDGSVVVALSVPDPTWGASTALSFGPLVTVLEPEAVRDMVAEWARMILAVHSEKEMEG